MRPNQRLWNQNHQALRIALSHPDDFPEAIALFLHLHAVLHSARMAPGAAWSFEDEVWQGLDEPDLRRIPENGEHSIVWNTWHIARIEDVTMNLLVAGSPQLLHQGGWLEKLQVSAQDTGNQMSAPDRSNLSASIDLQALRDYRLAVGCRTREIVRQLRPHELKHKVLPSRLRQVQEEGAVVEAAVDLLDYWGNRTIAGLLLMPPTRHNFVHLNESQRIREHILRRG